MGTQTNLIKQNTTLQGRIANESSQQNQPIAVKYPNVINSSASHQKPL